MKRWLFILLLPLLLATTTQQRPAWIRINQLGYTTGGLKVAVWCSKDKDQLESFQLMSATTRKAVFTSGAGQAFGAYGPFAQSYRLDFSRFKTTGRYYILAGGIASPEFAIGDNVYEGSADFCLRYMRQQRTGFNPYLKDSCHTHDGYVLYGEKAGIKDSTVIDAVGGWHDASDYLQYVTTSANATYHLLMAYRDFPGVFSDKKNPDGLDGENGRADVLDEAKWGLDWLLKMHPREDWMFNQIADDRDHMGMRIPKQDSFYGRGYQRPVYFVSGEPQQRGKFMNNTTGTASTAGKFASAFALGSTMFMSESKRKSSTADFNFAGLLQLRANSALEYGLRKPGASQTASVRSPYIYAEDNWVDDMELGSAMVHQVQRGKQNIKTDRRFLEMAYDFARKEPVTPWLGADTAKHYQWYPFINVGHYELAKQLKGRQRDSIIMYYREGIRKVWAKAKSNAFYQGIPFIWCSNNLRTSFAIQCYWYRELTGDQTFSGLEQANFDWLFGCNPWGTSMVYGLPAHGDTPVDPHSAFTHIGKYPIDGGLVDGPVYGSIYKSLIGIQLKDPDEYAEFQSEAAVYHDDYGDYSTNEPTMDGTASLIYLLAAKEAASKKPTKSFSYSHGGIIQGDTTIRNIALVFTGDEFGEGGTIIEETLRKENVKASFFLTGRFYLNRQFQKLIGKLKQGGHYLGPHSDQHLLYADWSDRNRLLVTKAQFRGDLHTNLYAMQRNGIDLRQVRHFLPPYEWYNDTIVEWTREIGLDLINYTPGTMSHADYTTPEMPNYRSSEQIYNSIISYENSPRTNLNGFILLTHIGAGPKRTDKFYNRLPALIKLLKAKGYQFQRVDERFHDPVLLSLPHGVRKN
ncbi:MAG: glycoside hydrolase family 9 protein [Chitinophagaceae bacterium]|nr:glycoside hydrolase family 9 protein [Chitinophagaceae bacterium]